LFIYNRIKAIKEPWHRSSHYKALGQMLLTNQWLDKLVASHVDFTKHSMMQGTCLQSVLSGLHESLDLPCDVQHNTDYFSPIEPPDLPDDGKPTAPVQSMTNDEDEDEDEDEDDGAVAGPKVMVHVDLAKTVCGCPCIVCPVTTIKTHI
jgi:hypothetical protein